MKQHRSTLNLIFCLSLSMAAALACGGSDSSPAPNNSASNTVSTPAGSSAPASTASTGKTDIAGTYDATGTGPDGGNAYQATLVVTPRDDVYQFSWDSAGQKYEGVGVITDSTAAVSYTDGDDGKGCGVVLYKIGADGSLDGRSGYWGVNSAESEKATRKSGTDLEGSYDLTGTNVEGKEYKGTLDVKKDGEGYTFRWNAGNTFDGFGIKQGDKVVVGFGGSRCSFVAYNIRPDGSLDGKWGAQGNKKFGTETAKKR